MQALNDILAALGLPPALLATGVVLAILLRYLRGSVATIGSGLTYLAAFVFGATGALLSSDGVDYRTVGQHALALTAFVLLAQHLLQQAAKVVPWLPSDDQWTTRPAKSAQDDKADRS